jgi:hypothetical protein
MWNWIMNQNGRGRKWSWPNLRYYPKICLEGLRKATNNLSQGSWSPSQDLILRPPKYEAGVITTWPWLQWNCYDCMQYWHGKILKILYQYQMTPFIFIFLDFTLSVILFKPFAMTIQISGLQYAVSCLGVLLAAGWIEKISRTLFRQIQW